MKTADEIYEKLKIEWRHYQKNAHEDDLMDFTDFISNNSDLLDGTGWEWDEMNVRIVKS